jgi:hypothetical protein
LETLSALRSEISLITLSALNASTGQTLETLSALRSKISLITLSALNAGTCETLVALGSLDARSGDALITLRSLNTRAGETLGALYARVSLRSLDAWVGSLETLLPLGAGSAAARSRRARGTLRAYTTAATTAARNEGPCRRREEDRKELEEVLREDDGVRVQNATVRHLDGTIWKTDSQGRDLPWADMDKVPRRFWGRDLPTGILLPHTSKNKR